jgi:hypothetical protein
VAGAATLNGCLVADRVEESYVLHPESGFGEYEVVFRDVKSNGPTPHHQQQDFDYLVKVLTGDGYLMERLRGGIYVKRRTVSIEEGKMIAREAGLIAEVTSVGMRFTPQGSIVRAMGSDRSVISTNGYSFEEGDSVFVRWGRGVHELTLVTKYADDRPSVSLVERYRAWKAKQK